MGGISEVHSAQARAHPLVRTLTGVWEVGGAVRSRATQPAQEEQDAQSETDTTSPTDDRDHEEHEERHEKRRRDSGRHTTRALRDRVCPR